MVGCGGAPKRAGSAVDNSSPECRAFYDSRPQSAAVRLMSSRVVWIENNTFEVKSVELGGGDVTSIKLSERLGSVYGVLVLGTDLIVADASSNSVVQISLADRTVTTLAKDIHHPYELAHANGSIFIGGEETFYRLDLATKELTELGEIAATHLAAHGEIVYAVLENHQLIAIDAAMNKTTVLADSLGPIDGVDVGMASFAATPKGPVWSTSTGEIWRYEVATSRARKLAQLAHYAFDIEPVGDDIYLAANGVFRLRGEQLTEIPIDRSRWDKESSKFLVTQIAIRGNALVYHTPFSAFASVCLDS